MNWKLCLFSVSLCLLFNNGSIAAVFGTDDFDDNQRDGTKWVLPDVLGFSGRLNEANSRLEFTNPEGLGSGSCTWLGQLPPFSNWMVSCDVTISGSPVSYDSQWK